MILMGMLKLRAKRYWALYLSLAGDKNKMRGKDTQKQPAEGKKQSQLIKSQASKQMNGGKWRDG